MGQEPRKATDVLLDIESNVRILLDIIRAQDLNIKILSNKLSDAIGRLDKQQAGPPKIIVETVQAPVPTSVTPEFPQIPAGDPEKNIPFVAESRLPQTQSPQGFRRNSRPETYAKDKPPVQPPELPIQIPSQAQGNMPPPGRGNGSEIVVAPSQSTAPIKRGSGAIAAPPQPVGSPVAEQPIPPSSVQGQIPVTQRCVNKNGKPVFLADVEIIDMSTSQPVFKTRTSGVGKWMASLGIGAYRVTIRKRETVTKEKIEAVQDIQVDGSVSKLELPMLIIK